MKNAQSLNPVSPYCTGCGGCAAASSGALTMDWDQHGFLVPRQVPGREVPESARRACPFPVVENASQPDEDVLAEHFLSGAPQVDPKIGKFHATYIGYSAEHRATSSSGGVATFVFEQLLKNGVADHIFVVSETVDGFKYRMVSNLADVRATSKTRYYPVTLEEFFIRAEQVQGTVAVSGVACFVKAVRLRQLQNPAFARKISFIVGIICGGLKSKSFTEYLADRAGAGLKFSNAQYRVKDAASHASDYSFSAVDNDGRLHSMKMTLVGDMWGTGMFKAKACDFCTDVLTELADISLGDAWLPEYRSDGLGNSVIVTRTFIADDILKSGIASGALNVAPSEPQRIISSQRASFSHRRDALQFRMWMAKVMRQPIPLVRRRVLRPIGFLYALVQVQREITRSVSLSLWKKRPAAPEFDKRMRMHRFVLKVFTKLHHLAK